MTRTRSLLAAALGAALTTSALTGTPATAATATVPLSDCASPDNGLPVVSSVGIGAHAVDAREQTQQLPVSAVVDDTGGPGAASGVAHVYVTFQASDLTARIPSTGTELTRQPDGRTWAGSVAFVPGSASGTWTATARAVDGAGHERVLDAAALRAMGTEPTIVVTSVADEDAPALRSLRLSRRAVDSRRHGRTVRVTARATDAVSGVAKVVVLVGGRPMPLRRTAGTPTDGIWRGSVAVARWAGVHTWPLRVRVGDRSSHLLTVTRSQLAHRGLPSTLRVVGRTDSTRPTISSQQVTPTSHDVRTEDGSVRVSVRVRDALSGVARVTASIEEIYGTAHSVRLHRVSGTRHDGVWAGSLLLAHCQTGYRPFSGDQTLSFAVGATDTAGRSAKLPRRQEQPFHVLFRDNEQPAFHATLATTGIVTVAVSEPVVASGSWDPSVADTRTGTEAPGTWTCADASGAAVDCATEVLQTAQFTPAHPLAPATRYVVELNREHTLHVVDLAGNPVVGVENDVATG